MLSRSVRHPILPFLLNWFLAGTLPLHAQSALSTEQILKRAAQLHQAGDLAGAVQDYERVLESGYQSPDLLSNLGAAYAGLGDFRRAIENYRKSLSLKEDNVNVRINLGLAYYKTAELDAALEQFGHVIEQDPGDFRAGMLSADIYFRYGNYPKVIELLNPLKEEAAEDPAFAYLMGTALIREGRVSEGQSYVDVVLRKPDSVAAHLMMGAAHMMAGEMEQAAAEIEKAIALDPTVPGSYSMLGRVLLLAAVYPRSFVRKDIPAAKEAFRKELEINPNDFDANFHLGSLLKEDREYDEALKYLTKAERLRPNAPEVSYQIATLQLLKNDPEQARVLLENLVEREPDFLEAHVSLASAYFRLNMQEEANRERDIIIKLNAEKQADKPKKRHVFGEPPDSTPPH